MLYTTDRFEKTFCGIIEYDDTRLLAAITDPDPDDYGNRREAEQEADGASRPEYEEDPDDREPDWPYELDDAEEEEEPEGTALRYD